MAKIFGIGLNKTGTSTLGACFEILGLEQMSGRRDVMSKYLYGDKQALFDLCDRYDAFQDWPYPLAYKDLFERYGDEARFVLTVRKDPEDWLRSLKNQSLRTRPRAQSQLLAYGYAYPHGFERRHIDFYNRHNEEVVAFFAEQGCPEKLKVLCWEAGDGWAELCDFLGVPVPEAPFPHARRTKKEWVCKKRNYRANVNRIKEQLDMLYRDYELHLDPPYSTFALMLPRYLRAFAWQRGWIR